MQKNRAENVMIVDLLRNDLGRVARFGSVQTAESVRHRALPHAMADDLNRHRRIANRKLAFSEIFRALFPCGSITGAPKVRAMQLSCGARRPSLAASTRGAIGFFSPRKTVFNVAIRTLDLNGGSGMMGAGSGVVIDSDAREEYRECLLKAEVPALLPTGPRSDSSGQTTLQVLIDRNNAVGQRISADRVASRPPRGFGRLF